MTVDFRELPKVVPPIHAAVSDIVLLNMQPVQVMVSFHTAMDPDDSFLHLFLVSAWPPNPKTSVHSHGINDCGPSACFPRANCRGMVVEGLLGYPAVPLPSP